MINNILFVELISYISMTIITECVKTIFYENYDDYEGEVENIDGEEVRQGFGRFVSDREGWLFTGKWRNNAIDGIGYLHNTLETSYLGIYKSSQNFK
jgi:hypothetical protein